MAEPISLAEAKAYLRVTDSSEDTKITAMIPRARLWVQDHTGLALGEQEFVEYRTPTNGVIELYKGPLVSVETVDYVDADGAPQTYVPSFTVGGRTLYPATDDEWPDLPEHGLFVIGYTAGIATIDDRLLGAMYALIEGEYSEGYAYPERATDAAIRCCAYLQAMVA